MIIKANHASLSLALRHLTQLKKQFLHAEIISRRNASGHYSERGHVFFFEARGQVKKKQRRTEYVVHFDYDEQGPGRRDLIRYQVHVFGPSGVSDREAIAAIRQIERGESPKGWKVKTILWGKNPPPSERKDIPLGSLKKSAILGGEASVSSRRKIPARKNRRTRKGAAKR